MKLSSYQLRLVNLVDILRRRDICWLVKDNILEHRLPGWFISTFNCFRVTSGAPSGHKMNCSITYWTNLIAVFFCRVSRGAEVALCEQTAAEWGNTAWRATLVPSWIAFCRLKHLSGCSFVEIIKIWCSEAEQETRMCLCNIANTHTSHNALQNPACSIQDEEKKH